MSSKATGYRLQATARGVALTLFAAVVFPLSLSAFAAQPIDYDPRRAPELRKCDDHEYRGRRAQAESCYTDLFASSANVLVRAEAAWALGELQRANELFQNLTKANEKAVEPRVRWGRLFTQAHQYNDAVTVFQQALAISPKDPQAQLGLAAVLVERFEGQARELIADVLKQDENLLEAHLLSARMALEEGQIEETEKALDRATDLANKQKLPPLDVYTLRAALAVSRGDNPDAWIKRALDYNPSYGAIFEQLAHFEVMKRRYTQATTLLQRAVEVQPDLWSAHAELGANLMRLGDIEGSRRHLTSAYSGDPFSPTTVNSLRLLDRMGEDFDFTTTKLTIPAQRGGQQEVELRLRLSKKEADVIRPYVVELTRDSIATFTRRYNFELREPVTLELYPDHDDFAVRVAALPGIGLLGVTFGYLVAMDSPSGRATGEFHWGSTLWHEMAHVFTLEATDHRVPRWLSEGISVFEEWRTGPTPGVAIPPEVIAAIAEKKLLPVSDLDSGFIRPSYPNQIQISYMQAGLVCLFIEQRWGFERLVALLKQFTRDMTTADAVEATFKIEPEEFDKEFDAFVRQRYAGILPRMAEWEQWYETASKAMSAEKWADAVEPARKAMELYPEHVGPDSPAVMLAFALDKLGRRSEAVTVLDTYRKAGGWDPSALRQLGTWLDEAGQAQAATEVLTALNYADPMSSDHHVKLGERLLTAKRPSEALREYDVLIALKTHDQAQANFGAARALREMGEGEASRRRLLDALATAPFYKPAQELLLKTIEERTKNE